MYYGAVTNMRTSGDITSHQGSSLCLYLFDGWAQFKRKYFGLCFLLII